MSDKEGFRKDVMAAVKDMGVPFLRWPGGNFSSNYNWRTASARATSARARLEMAWGTVENNRFGTHEFMDYVEKVGAEPYICLNLGTGTWTDGPAMGRICQRHPGHRHHPAAQEEWPRQALEGEILGPGQ